MPLEELKLRIKDLSFAYSDDLILDNLSFEVKPNKVLGVVGASGSGKTTLLQLLAGNLEPNYGYIQLGKSTIQKPSERLIAGDNRVALVAQDYDLMRYVSAASTLHGQDFSNEQKEQRKGKRLQRALQLKLKETQKTHELSGGQKQRLAIGKAVSKDAQVLLLDEPFSNLDFPLKADLQHNLVKKWKKPLTVLVTHEPADLLSLCDELLVLKNGRIAQIGDAQEVYHQPKNIYIAELLGAINKISVHLANALKLMVYGKRKYVLVRPTALQFARTGIKAKVLDVRFTGQLYAYTCLCNGFEEQVLVYSLNRYEKGKVLCIKKAPNFFGAF